MNGEKRNHPFSRGELAKSIGSPEFQNGAKLDVKAILIAGVRQLCVRIPMADGNPDSRVYAYNVVVVGDDPKKRFFKSVFFSGVNRGIGHEPDKGFTLVKIPVSDLPEGRQLTLAVRPLSSLGTKGKAIGTTLRV